MQPLAGRARGGAALLVIAVLLVGGGTLALAGGLGRPAGEPERTGPVPRPSPADPPPMRSVSIGEHTTMVSPGDAAIVRAQVPPGAACGIVVLHGPGPPKAPELVAKVADERGVVEWAWKVHEATPRGRWPVIVVCRSGDHEEEDGYYLRIE